MKVAFVILSALATLAISADEQPHTEILKKYIDAVMECGKKADFKDVKDLGSFWKQDGAPLTKTAQCLIACTWKEMGIITNNKLNMAQVESLSAPFRLKDQAKYDAVKKVVESCAQETDNDECVAVHKIFTCVKEGAKKSGIFTKA